MFLIALVGVYMVVPWFYRTYVIESIIEWYDRKESSGYICKKHDDFPECAETRIAQSNTIFWLFAIAIVSLHFFEGIVKQDSTHLALSMYIFIAFIGAVLAIMMKSNDPRFYYHKSHQLYLPREEAYSNFGWPSEVLGTGLSILGIKEGKTQMPWYVVYVLLFLVTFIIGIMFRLYGKGDGMSYQALVFAALIYSITLGSFLQTIFNRESNVYTDTDGVGPSFSETKSVKAKPAVDDEGNPLKQITNWVGNLGNLFGQGN